MRFRRLIAARTQFGLRQPAVMLGLIYLALFSHPAFLQAQDPSLPDTPPAPDASAYVLHAYANLVQIPTLILSPELSPLPPIHRDDVNISLDSGPPFHPTHMRVEGDDPLDLAILLDLSGPAYHLQSAFSHSIEDFVSRSLRPGDRLSIYVADCFLLRSANNVSASDGAMVERVLNKALHFPGIDGQSVDAPGCTRTNRLWNVLAKIATSMNDPHRRRVILAISTGVAHKSHIKWDQLKRFSASRSIAIFGLYPELASDQFTLQLSSENPFNSLCQLTGGMVFDTWPTSIGLDLSYAVEHVRNRYILEFPRPSIGKGGLHSIAVKLSDERAFIRPAGITYPVPDPASLSGPNTIPSPPSPAIYGKRSTLSPPQ
jgi:hypothetical protein